MPFRCLAETLFGNGAIARGTLMAFLFLACLEGSSTIEEDDGETVIATGVAIGGTAIGEDAAGEEIYCV